ncbi:HTH_Tnp_Tc3_2 domain-containing protein [Trichonephila clavipes]|nr:HTH_Tnp_Tc3_2 domain-containing protein [Trichonephila clavipes]
MLNEIYGWLTASMAGLLSTPRKSIVRSQQSQTSAQITTQLNDDASRIVSKRTVQHLLHRMGFANRRTTRVPLLDAWHWVARLAWTREQTNWSVENWKRVA